MVPKVGGAASLGGPTRNCESVVDLLVGERIVFVKYIYIYACGS